MDIGSDPWNELIIDGAARLGITVDQNQALLLARHANLLMTWNRKVNLTAIVDPAEVAVKHYLDAIAPLAYIPPDGHLLDIGTGGGFPGIPLKILRPSQPMLLIDGARKKINFVKHVIRELGLQSIEARQIRAEILAREASQPKFEVIVCRALSDLKQVVQWADPLLTPGGQIVAYRGPDDPQDAVAVVAPSPQTIQGITYQSKIHAYHLPVSGDRRTVAIIRAGQ